MKTCAGAEKILEQPYKPRWKAFASNFFHPSSLPGACIPARNFSMWKVTAESNIAESIVNDEHRRPAVNG